MTLLTMGAMPRVKRDNLFLLIFYYNCFFIWYYSMLSLSFVSVLIAQFKKMYNLIADFSINVLYYIES